MANAPTSVSRVFYGWIITAFAFLILFVGFGMYYSFGVFIKPLMDQFHGDNASVSLAFSISTFILFAMGVFSGRLTDRYGPRPVVGAAAVMLGVSLIATGLSQSLWQLYLTCGIGVGLGMAFSYVPSVSTVQRWFVRQRGLASGLGVAGVGLGSMVMPQLAQRLIDSVGWRNAYFVFGVIGLVVVGSAAMFLVRSPADKGLLPDGDGLAVAGSPLVIEGMTTKEAIRTKEFQLLYISAMFASAALYIPLSFLAPFARSQGFAEFGPLLIGIVGLCSSMGRLVAGPWADRIGRHRAYSISFVLLSVAMGWWIFSNQQWSLVIFAVIFGVGYGGMIALIPALATDYFGARHVSGILGILYTGAGFGGFIGPFATGAAIDHFGSYTVPIAAGLVANLVSLVLILLLRDPEVEPRLA